MFYIHRVNINYRKILFTLSGFSKDCLFFRTTSGFVVRYDYPSDLPNTWLARKCWQTSMRLERLHRLSGINLKKLQKIYYGKCEPDAVVQNYLNDFFITITENRKPAPFFKCDNTGRPINVKAQLTAELGKRGYFDYCYKKIIPARV